MKWYEHICRRPKLLLHSKMYWKKTSARNYKKEETGKDHKGAFVWQKRFHGRKETCSNIPYSPYRSIVWYHAAPTVSLFGTMHFPCDKSGQNELIFLEREAGWFTIEGVGMQYSSPWKQKSQEAECSCCTNKISMKHWGKREWIMDINKIGCK